jgi:hypothetical protein
MSHESLKPEKNEDVGVTSCNKPSLTAKRWENFEPGCGELKRIFDKI